MDNTNIFKLMYKALRKKTKISILLVIITCVCMVFASLYWSFFEIKKYSDIKTGKELYGKYDFQMADISKSDTEKITAEDCVDESCVYTLEFDPVNKLYNYRVKSDFFGLMNVKLKEGRLPQNENEVLCEEKFLYKQGLEFKNDGTTEIKIDEKSYTVTGIVYINMPDVTMYTYIPSLFHYYNENIDYGRYSIACTSIHEKYVNDAEKLKQKYHVSDSDFIYNTNLFTYAEINETGKSTNVFSSLKYIILGLMIFLFIVIIFNIIFIIGKKIKSDLAVFRSLGIKAAVLRMNFTKIIMKLVITGVISGTLISGICSGIFVNSIAKGFHIWKLVCQIIILDTAVVFIVGLLAYNISKNIIKGNIYKSVANSSDISEKTVQKSRLYKKKMPFVRIAKINMSSYKKKNILSVLVIVLAFTAITLFRVFSVYLFGYEENVGYEYKINYEYSDVESIIYGSDEIQKMYDDMAAQPSLFDICPVYYSNVIVEVDKKDISEKYKEYYSKLSNENYLKFYVNKYGTYSDNFIFVGVDEEIYKKLYDGAFKNISDDECIVIENVTSPNNTGFSNGLRKGAKIQYGLVSATDMSKYYLTVADSIPDIKIQIPDSYYRCVILVNMNIFRKLEFYRYPQMILFNNLSNDDEKIYEFFKGINDIDVVNIYEKNHDIQLRQLVMNIFAYTLFAILVVLLSLNTLISLYDKFDTNKNIFAMLKAIGIKNNKICLIQLYENTRTVILSLILGSGFSYAASYIVYLYTKKNLYSYIFKFTLKDVMPAVVIILIIYALAFIPSIISIKKINVTKNLQTNR